MVTRRWKSLGSGMIPSTVSTNFDNLDDDIKQETTSTSQDPFPIYTGPIEEEMSEDDEILCKGNNMGTNNSNDPFPIYTGPEEDETEEETPGVEEILCKRISKGADISNDPFSIYTGPEEEGDTSYARKSSAIERGSTCTVSTKEPSDDIYYFGVGPIVNSLVRKRQQVNVSEDQAAVLNDFRLTFVKGGVANVIPSRGFEVHGVVMKIESGWEKYLKWQPAYTQLESLVEVYPYNGGPPLLATVFSLQKDEVDPDSGMEELAEERYLRLIASGLRKYKVDEDYIESEIMSVPFVPIRREWKKIPCKDGKREADLPKIAFKKYQQLCRKQQQNKKQKKTCYFIVGRHVVEIAIDDDNNQGAQWFMENAHGESDLTWTCYQVVVDSEVPAVESPSELTPLHLSWAEEQINSYLERCNLSATKVYQLSDGNALVSKLFRRSMKVAQEQPH
eukprot:CAMPEP_0194211266 /NCGR_PEP_ID=MMETSP0156-20130528/9849_1 /TAXON_ID=33649 /ORGANISM="Thalassionema nitzschioides, Strain L26-B" /LENGTH=447 /DNA_ID=CAMNT_0038938775 /DNA_START=185 /DNA_END=1528 /DNA_ORIENTATION=+